MSRTTRTPEAIEPSPAPNLPITFADFPAVAALLTLTTAVTALASFPSSPVPDALVRNVVSARDAFQQALGEPIALSAAGEDAPYDDTALIETMTKLEGAVQERLDSLDAALKERFAGLDQTIEALKSADKTVDLTPLEKRIAALEKSAAAKPESA